MKGLMTAGSSRDCCLGRANTRCGGGGIAAREEREERAERRGNDRSEVEAALCYHRAPSAAGHFHHLHRTSVTRRHRKPQCVHRVRNNGSASRLRPQRGRSGGSESSAVCVRVCVCEVLLFISHIS